MDDSYRDQARLMLEMIPWLMRSSRFAIKGGSATNFFLRAVPRLSVRVVCAVCCNVFIFIFIIDVIAL